MQRYVDHVESVKYVRGDDWRHEDARHAGHDKAKRRGFFSRICCGFSITAYVHSKFKTTGASPKSILS